MNQRDPLIVKVLGYCIMPDHYHLIVRAIADNDQIVKYLSKVENAYAKYFNMKTERHGHLWSESFKSVIVNSEEQLLYLTKYVHLNPVKAIIVNKAEDYKYSSFNDYMNVHVLRQLNGISISNPAEYREFVSAHKDYSKKLEELDSNKILID